MKHIGTINLENNKLLLRKFILDDAQLIYKNFSKNDKINKHTKSKSIQTLEDGLDIVTQFCNNYQHNDYYNWAIISKENNELIGSINILEIDTNNSTTCHIDYYLSKEDIYEDLAVNSFQLILNFLFNDIGFTKITYNSSNEIYDNVNIFKKLNFNVIENNTTYSITKDDFNKVDIRKPYKFEIEFVAEIYNGIITHLDNNTNFCGWKHGIYPTLEVAQKAFDDGDLFIATKSGEVIGSCILNHTQAKQYHDIDWHIKDDKPLVVHTVAINPKNLRQGVAHKLLEFSKAYAKELNLKSIRLDASEPNTPARKIYEDVGFIKRGEMDLETNRGGINNWFAYEFIIN